MLRIEFGSNGPGFFERWLRKMNPPIIKFMGDGEIILDSKYKVKSFSDGVLIIEEK